MHIIVLLLALAVYSLPLFDSAFPRDESIYEEAVGYEEGIIYLG